ncbi:proclotting enzyme-like [Onthophagus taurus]|uniref:proclotting enzyme-like n=1 Tax=Onthophagus taurus TaxID=166361 RepID=UPI000C209F5A|nr:proclotting enzyme-like [Onthophagus taurus]
MMGFLIRLFVVCCSLHLIKCLESSNLDDTIVVESEAYNRQTRQIFLNAIPIILQQPVFEDLSKSPCFTKDDEAGLCMSFRQCYPTTEEPNFQNWLLSVQNTCEYRTAQGRKLVGVCCTGLSSQSNSIPFQILNDSSVVEKQFIHGGWPPPLPTHPPSVTIPPLPTHPPTTYPQWTTSTLKPPNWPPQTTKPPNWPPQTTKPPNWPPQTTKPVWPPNPTPAKPTPPTTSYSECGMKNGDQNRIVGGHNADINAWPWMAALFNNGRQFCGGSLIDNIHILSAAHCVAHMSSWDVARLTVRLGDHNIHSNYEIQHVEKRVKRVVRHRGFDSRTLYNDVAVLTMDSPVTFSKQIRPICLPTASDGTTGRAGQRATVIGWGSLRETGPQPSILQEVDIPIWSNTECRIKYGPAAPGGITEHMLCAGQIDKDSCSGDSGGPLMINSGKWTQAGVVSWGIGCGKGQYPGVYSRVESFLPWIQKNLKDS